LQRLRDQHEPAIVVIGRPYNVNDAGVNLDLPRKIADLGYTVVPLDFLPFDPKRIPPLYKNLFWAYGQRILAGLDAVRDNENLFAVYLTNFNCGPDSFMLSYAEEIMGDKPMLTLEIDEHGADAGYMTRVEAFLNVVKNWHPTPKQSQRRPAETSDADLRGRRIFIPPMHPFSSELTAASFRAEGFDAVALPTEARADFDLGQKLARGSECLPLRTTLGSFLNAAKTDVSGKPLAFFMPGGNGPCRFGQYMPLQEQLLARTEHHDTLLVSPSHENFYFGLSSELRRRLWPALLSGDMLMKLLLRVRPYERIAGDADQLAETFKARLSDAITHREEPRHVLRAAGEAFARIPVRDERRPLVGIVGEIYVRNNPFCNEDLAREIESAGGECWLVPLSEWLVYTAAEDVRRFQELPKNLSSAVAHAARIVKSKFLTATEGLFYDAVGPMLADRHEPPIQETIRAAWPYLRFSVGGESLLTLGRAVTLVSQGARLIVNASPFGCMAGTVAAAILAQVEKDTGVTMVNAFYEGTGTENRRLKVFLANLPAAAALSGPPKPAHTTRRFFSLWPGSSAS